ncbi:MAG TPA: hypothetical protein PK668_17670 [Myxococcota bacterium]|nr:hypothetical protein [Myxococcota bacterium]HRY95790.1 hypothetical protein [Myxococcota bacterium]HSA21169.1 hypothetical protein [Myxococcota bacterium]
MKTLGKLLGGVVVLALALGALGCEGGARTVDSCDDCIQDTNEWHRTEYCVYGDYSQLYCANPCYSDLDCEPLYDCVPLTDQGTWYDPSGTGDTRWVCMPHSFYVDDGRVWRWADDCSTGMGHECAAGMTCLYDDSGLDDIFFCSDPCTYDEDCLTDCCYDTGTGDYCAPYRYCD